MGCCLSTTRLTKSLDQDVGAHKLPESDVKGGGAPSPALILEEEETVKEVLSETQTPISMPSTTLPKMPNIKHTSTLTNINSLNTKLQLGPNDRLKEPVEEQEEISVVSEMCSISGSFSTTTVNDGEEAGEVNQRMIHHSPAKKRSSSRIIARAKYGRRRPLDSSDSREITRGRHRSPAPSSQVKSRPVQGRTASMVQRRNVSRRDGDCLVECSGKRLGYPAAVSQVTRDPRTTVPSVTGHLDVRSRVRKLEESKRIENHDGAVSRESLDNPRVSLECFIFL